MPTANGWPVDVCECPATALDISHLESSMAQLIIATAVSSLCFPVHSHEYAAGWLTLGDPGPASDHAVSTVESRSLALPCHVEVLPIEHLAQALEVVQSIYGSARRTPDLGVTISISFTIYMQEGRFIRLMEPSPAGQP